MQHRQQYIDTVGQEDWQTYRWKDE